MTRRGIDLTALDSAGLFYGRQTLCLLATAQGIPCVEIIDNPCFGYRGIHLDVSRHFFPVETIFRLLDEMARYKLNKFHFHLADNGGWRIRIDAYPLLTRLGAFRTESDWLEWWSYGDRHYVPEDTPGAYGGYYTKEEIRRIVAYAAERFIEVIPEIEFPGHSDEVFAAYPELCCSGRAYTSGEFCVGNPLSLKFMDEVLTEVLELFPSKYIHIGGDEAPKTRWKECPKCQARMREKGLKNEEELQGWFVLQAIDFLKKHGKTAIVWNESLNSGMMPKDIIVQRWMDKKDRSVEFANNGGKMIVSEFYYYYCDYPYGMTSLKKTYSLDPYIKGLTEEGKKNVFGVECPIWTEYIRDFDRLSYMCFPRFWAVAEAGWTKRENMDCESFEERFEALRPMLENIGIKPAPRSDWNPNPLRCLSELRKFFKGTANLPDIKNMIHNNHA